MGNGHAPGTATGLGAAGVNTAVTGFDAGLPREAGLAVFFFAAFLTAGFLAGFFLAGFVRTSFFLATAFTDFWAGFLADALRLAATLRPADFFTATFFLRAVLDVFFGAAFFFAAFFLLDFFDALPIRLSIVCNQNIPRRRQRARVDASVAAHYPDSQGYDTANPHPDARRLPTSPRGKPGRRSP